MTPLKLIGARHSTPIFLTIGISSTVDVVTKRVLVTGAKGYLGGRLVTALARNGQFEVTGTTRTDTSPPYGWPEGANLVNLNLGAEDTQTISSALRGVDTVVHLAGANEILSAADPARALDDTGVATVKLLDAARKASCRRFIYLSTIHVYGSPLKGRISEDTFPVPRHPYAITHRVAEDFVLAAQAKGEIEGIALRLSNGIGAPAWAAMDRWTLIGNDLCLQAARTRRVVLRTSGLQWRDFITLTDFTRAICHSILIEPGAIGDGLFNLGGRMTLRMLDLAQLVANQASTMMGCPVPVEAAPKGPEEFHPALDFVIDRFVATGFVPSSHQTLRDEIKATLQLCLSDGFE